MHFLFKIVRNKGMFYRHWFSNLL